MLKVLVYQVGLLGDTLVSIPSYRAVRRHFGKDAHITVVHNEGHGRGTTAQQILKGTDLADDFISFPQSDGRSNLMTAVTLFPKVVARRFDIAVYIGPSERTPHIIRRHHSFFRLCGIRRFVGFHAYDHAIFEGRDEAGLLLPMRHESELLLNRLTADGIAADDANDFAEPLIAVRDADDADQWLQQRRPEGRHLVAIGPGGNQPAKHWDLDRFVEIGRRLRNAGCDLLVIGTQQERAAADTLLTGWGSGIDAVGQFSIAGTALLLSRCDFLVGLDTGTTHLAAAVGTPCVALYADRDPPGQWYPRGNRHIILTHRVPCGGCDVVHCPQPGHPCMDNITVEQVWAACKRMLDRPETPCQPRSDDRHK